MERREAVVEGPQFVFHLERKDEFLLELKELLSILEKRSLIQLSLPPSLFFSLASFYSLPCVADFIIDILLGSPSAEVRVFPLLVEKRPLARSPESLVDTHDTVGRTGAWHSGCSGSQAPAPSAI